MTTNVISETHETTKQNKTVGRKILHTLLTIESAALTVRRVQKHGRYIAEDLVEDFTHGIKRRPMQSVTIAATAAFALGAFVGWYARARRPMIPQVEE